MTENEREFWSTVFKATVCLEMVLVEQNDRLTDIEAQIIELRHRCAEHTGEKAEMIEAGKKVVEITETLKRQFLELSEGYTAICEAYDRKFLEA